MHEKFEKNPQRITRIFLQNKRNGKRLKLQQKNQLLFPFFLYQIIENK